MVKPKVLLLAVRILILKQIDMESLQLRVIGRETGGMSNDQEITGGQ